MSGPDALLPPAGPIAVAIRRLLLHVFEGPEHELRTTELTGRSIAEGLELAAVHTRFQQLWALAAITEEAEPRMIWVSGYDYRRAPENAAEWRSRQEMQSRFLAERSRREEPLVLPDGLRVFRMFPEWGVSFPLWESCGEHHPFEPGTLDLPDSLERELGAWGRAWWSVDGEDPNESPEWFEAGRELHRRLQAALEGIAEVTPAFLLTPAE